MEKNSAGRLLQIVKALEPSKAFSHEAIRSMFKVDPTKIPELEKYRTAYTAISDLQIVYEEFIVDMRDNYPLTAQTETILAGLESLKRLVYCPNIDGGISKLDGSVFALLEVCAKGLSTENEIPGSEFDQLRASLQSLRELTKTVKPALRKVLLELIRISEEAIAKYEIRGAAGMKKALKQMWGELAEIWRVETPDETDKEEKASVIQAVKAFILSFDSVYAKAVKYRPLLEYVPMLLNGPS